MCYLITATLPEDANLTKLKPVIEQYKMGFQPLTNAAIIPLLPMGNLYFTATRTHCDCDTVLGCELQTENWDDSNKSGIKRLRRKGWSQAKIDRWIIESEQKKEAEKQEQQLKNEAEAQRWLSFFKDMLATGKVSNLGILKHWYSGSIEEEQFIIKDTVDIRISHITPGFLFALKEDTLYKFYP